jgi:hypothetical protein
MQNQDVPAPIQRLEQAKTAINKAKNEKCYKRGMGNNADKSP